MVILSDDQINQMAFPDDDAFIQFFIQDYREENPRRISGYAPAFLASMVRTGLVRARHYGFDDFEDITVFITLMFEVAANFYEHPSFQKILIDPTIPTANKLDELFDQIPEPAWKEATDADDPTAWFDDDDELEGD